MQVERGRGSLLPNPSGGRVSNAWATYPMQGDNIGKPVLIPHKAEKGHPFVVKELRHRMGPRLIS